MYTTPSKMGALLSGKGHELFVGVTTIGGGSTSVDLVVSTEVETTALRWAVDSAFIVLALRVVVVVHCGESGSEQVDPPHSAFYSPLKKTSLLLFLVT